MSPTEPKMVAAPIGPIPRMSHRLVLEVDTAVLMRFLDARSWVSKRAISSTSSVAITIRCRVTSSVPSTLSSSELALLTVNFEDKPPAVSSAPNDFRDTDCHT